MQPIDRGNQATTSLLFPLVALSISCLSCRPVIASCVVCHLTLDEKVTAKSRTSNIVVLHKISCVIINQDCPRPKDKVTSDLGSLCLRNLSSVSMLVQNNTQLSVTADRLVSTSVKPMILLFDAIMTSVLSFKVMKMNEFD